MKEHTAFLYGIRSIKRRVWFQTVKAFLETAAVICLTLYTAYSLWHRFGSFTMKGSDLFLMAAGISLVSSFVLAAARRKTFSRHLIDIDTRLRLQDRLSTAYEYLQKKKETVFFDLLIQDAGEIISQIDKRKIFPKKLSWIHILLAALILLNLLMTAFKYAPDEEASSAISPETLNRIKTVIRQYTTGRDAKSRTEKEDRPDRLSKQMTDLSDMLDNPAVQHRQMEEMLDGALKEIQSDKIARARDLIEELGLDDIEDVSVEQIQQSSRLTAFQLKKLHALINGIFDDQPPRAVTEELTELDKQRRMEAYLEQIIEEIKNDRLQRAAPKDGMRERSERTTSAGASNRERAEKSDNPMTAGRKPGTESARESTGDNPLAGEGDDARGDPDGESFDQGPSSAGRGKSQDQSDDADRLNSVERPAVQDKTATSQRSELSVLVRSLTSPGTAKAARHPIIQDYRRSVESILQKEEIPLNYRNYIKNYFLSIGLRKEPSISGRKQ